MRKVLHKCLQLSQPRSGWIRIYTVFNRFLVGVNCAGVGSYWITQSKSSRLSYGFSLHREYFRASRSYRHTLMLGRLLLTFERVTPRIRRLLEEINKKTSQ